MRLVVLPDLEEEEEQDSRRKLEVDRGEEETGEKNPPRGTKKCKDAPEVDEAENVVRKKAKGEEPSEQMGLERAGRSERRQIWTQHDVEREVQSCRKG